MAYSSRRFTVIGSLVFIGLAANAGCGSDSKGGNGGPIGDGGPDGASSGGAASSAGGASSGGAPAAAGGATSGGSVGTGGSILADARSPEETGNTCQTPSDCYQGLVVGDGGLSGAIECIDRVQDGYCTHRCDTDADCCGAPGECRTTLRQVCAPFENQPYKVCFLSCEEEDLRPAADAGTRPDGAPIAVDSTEFCQREANADFVCRSSGGGQTNRKICVPGGTAGDGGPPRPDAAVVDAALDVALPDAAPEASPEAASPEAASPEAASPEAASPEAAADATVDATPPSDSGGD